MKTLHLSLEARSSLSSSGEERARELTTRQVRRLDRIQPLKRLKILMLTRLFPSRVFPTLGTFCMERARALAQYADVRIVVPTPYFPPWISGPKEWRVYADVERESKTQEGLRVTYPRYMLIPKTATWA